MFEGSAVERSLRPDDGVVWFNSRALLRCGAIESVEPVCRLENTSFSFRPAAAVSAAGWVSSTERCLFLLGPGAPMLEKDMGTSPETLRIFRVSTVSMFSSPMGVSFLELKEGCCVASLRPVSWF